MRWTGTQYGSVENNRKCEIKNGNGFIREFYYNKYCSEIDIKYEYENGEKNGKQKKHIISNGLLNFLILNLRENI